MKEAAHGATMSGQVVSDGPSSSDGPPNPDVDVSVIIPVHNAAAWLHECLLSVLGQSGVTVELVCVNDGSDDDSLRILREYEELEPTRVRVIDQPNGGQALARNAGIDAARGRYTCLLDSDDYWQLDALSTLVRRADEDNLDVVQFDAVAFRDAGVSDESWRPFANYYARSPARVEVVTGAELAVSQFSASEYKPSACLYMTRTSLLTNNDVRFVTGIMHEDNPFTFAVMLNAGRAVRVALDFYARRVRANSIMTSASVEKSMRGYFLSYLEMQREAVRHSYDPQTARTLGALLFRLFNTASSRFNKLDNEAISRVKELVVTPDAQVAFAMLIKNRKLSLESAASRAGTSNADNS
ncbi:glycosyltransferase [Microbacterium jejuense]|uniref:glycosyltransferase n=1 Tax=Microbacterium jejuense TaxID=1263637 RepID=UPI0031E55A40